MRRISLGIVHKIGSEYAGKFLTYSEKPQKVFKPHTWRKRQKKSCRIPNTPRDTD